MAVKTDLVQHCIEDYIALEHGAWFHCLRFRFPQLCEAIVSHESRSIFRGRLCPTSPFIREAKAFPATPSPKFVEAVDKYGLDGLIVRKTLKKIGDTYWLPRLQVYLQELFRRFEGLLSYFEQVWEVYNGWPREEFRSWGRFFFLRAVDRYSPEQGAFISFVSVSMKRARLKTIYALDDFVHVPVRDYHKLGVEDPEALPSRLDLYTPVYPGKDDKILLDYLHTNEPSVEEQFLRQEVVSILTSVIDQLEERKKAIIYHSFGFNGHKVKTLRELARQFGISHERVRQLREIALNELRTKLRSVFTKYQLGGNEFN